MTKVQALFIANLRRERKQAGYSQEKLADLIGLSPKYISSLEIGTRFPSPDTIQKISDTLKIEPYQLLLDTTPAMAASLNAIHDFQNYLCQELPGCLKTLGKHYIDGS